MPDTDLLDQLWKVIDAYANARGVLLTDKCGENVRTALVGLLKKKDALEAQNAALRKALEEAHEEILMLAGPNDMADEGYPMKRTDEVLELIRDSLRLAKGGA